MLENLNIERYLGLISTAIVVLTAIAAFFGKIKIKIATSWASLINVDKLNRDSSLYKTLDINTQILDQVNNINVKNIDAFGKINDQFSNINKSLLRLEITSLLDHRTSDHATIYKLYEDYKESGGNSYIDKLMKDWETGNYPSVDKVVEKKVKDVEEKVININKKTVK